MLIVRLPLWGQISFQDGATPIIELLIYFHDYIIMILILVIVFVTYVFGSLIFTPLVDKYTIDSHVLETVWTIVPIVILFFMAFPSLYLLYLIEDISNPSVTVKVVGHQWYWEYQYSNSWVTSSFDSYMIHESANSPLLYNLDVDNRLVLPTLSTVMFLVTSADVIHSWTVPSLGIKTDAIPGRLNYISSLVPLSGIYYGQCREICGANHRFMPIVVEFVTVECFLSHLSRSEDAL